MLTGILLTAPAAFADDTDRARNDAGLGMATVLANVFYMPVKIGYAAVGGVTGGLGYLLTGGNREVAEKVWVPALGGDYVLSRDMVAGEDEIDFSGERDPDL
jgi:hypothetical protein